MEIFCVWFFKESCSFHRDAFTCSSVSNRSHKKKEEGKKKKEDDEKKEEEK